MNTLICPITSADVIESEALRLGLLPFFCSRVSGFSIEEHTPSSLWFHKDVEGPWEWKGLVIRRGNVAYAKLLEKKAAYVSLDLFCHLANIRRANINLAADEKEVLDVVSANDTLLSTDIADLCGFAKSHSKLDFLVSDSRSFVKRRSLDSILTSLQMSCRLVVADFEYKRDKLGRPYGWGVARYATPESLYADSFALPNCSQDESLDFVAKRLAIYLSDDEVTVLMRKLAK